MSKRLKINNSRRLQEVKNDLRTTLYNERHMFVKTLEPIADEMYVEAVEQVPLDTGALRDSIEVRVSRSPRYPGIIATASAKNINTGYDYALIQHEHTGYLHDAGRKPYYLSDPFEEAVKKFEEKMGYDS